MIHNSDEKSTFDLNTVALTHLLVGGLLWLVTYNAKHAGNPLGILHGITLFSILVLSASISTVGFGGFFLPAKRDDQTLIGYLAIKCCARGILIGILLVLVQVVFRVFSWDWTIGLSKAMMLVSLLLGCISGLSLDRKKKDEKTKNS